MDKKTFLVCYHDDMDGVCCATAFKVASIKWFNPETDVIKYIPVQYGQAFPYDQLGTGYNNVHILDFSYPVEVMFEMRKRVDWITHIDHHKIDVEKYHDIANFFLHDITKSATELCWLEYNRYEPMPELIKLMGERDMWIFSSPKTRWYHAGLMHRYGRVTPQDIYTVIQYSDDEKEILKNGRFIDEHNLGICRQIANKAIPIRYLDETFGFVEATGMISDVGNTICETQNVNFSMSYFVEHTEKAVIFSLRSQRGKTTFDMSAIAKMYGGGGRETTAGFKLPLEDGFNLIKFIVNSGAFPPASVFFGESGMAAETMPAKIEEMHEEILDTLSESPKPN